MLFKYKFGCFVRSVIYWIDAPYYHYGLFVDFIQVKSYKSYLGFIRRDKYTLITDLLLSENEIVNLLKKQTAYEIRRAQNDPVTFNMDDCRENFMICHKAFVKSRNGLNDNIRFELYNQSLKYCCVYMDDRPIIAHAYLIDRNFQRVELFYSSSGIADIKDSALRSLYGRVNKRLCYLAILKFKEEGYSEYDWGGISLNSDDPKLRGIREFKEQFGGRFVHESNYQSLAMFLIKTIALYIKSIKYLFVILKKI